MEITGAELGRISIVWRDEDHLIPIGLITLLKRRDRVEK
jgi:hypothetical protein